MQIEETLPEESEESGICPILGSSMDSTTPYDYSSQQNRCFADYIGTRVSREHQQAFCISGHYERCPIYRNPELARKERIIHALDTPIDEDDTSSVYDRNVYVASNTHLSRVALVFAAMIVIAGIIGAIILFSANGDDDVNNTLLGSQPVANTVNAADTIFGSNTRIPRTILTDLPTIRSNVPIISTATSTPTASETATPTSTFTATTNTVATEVALQNDIDATNTAMVSPTATNTASPSPSETPSETPSHTASATQTSTATPSNTATQTETPSPTPSATTSDPTADTPTVTQRPSDTPTYTATASETLSPSATASNTATDTPTATQRPSNTPTDTVTATETLSPSATASNTATDTATATQTLTATPSNTATDIPSPTASNTATNTLTATQTLSATPTSTATSTTTPTLTPSVTNTPTSTDTPTLTATATNTATYTPSPSFTPFPTLTSTPSPTLSGTLTLVPPASPASPFTNTPRPQPSSAEDINQIILRIQETYGIVFAVPEEWQASSANELITFYGYLINIEVTLARAAETLHYISRSPAEMPPETLFRAVFSDRILIDRTEQNIQPTGVQTLVVQQDGESEYIIQVSAPGMTNAFPLLRELAFIFNESRNGEPLRIFRAELGANEGAIYTPGAGYNGFEYLFPNAFSPYEDFKDTFARVLNGDLSLDVSPTRYAFMIEYIPRWVEAMRQG